MKNIFAAFAAVLLTAGAAAASTTYAQFCSNCHLRDTTVTVSVAQFYCTQSTAFYQVNVSDTYDGSEGWAVYGPTGFLTNRLGAVGTFAVPTSSSYSVFGVSDQALAGALGGSNTAPFIAQCSINCIDVDNDGYNIGGGGCGPVDCNDADATINPTAAEIWRDDIDQDCNGFDLTLDVTKASFSPKRKVFSVEAQSLYVEATWCNFSVDGSNWFGMSRNKRTGLFTGSLTTSSAPAQVWVRTVEGTRIETVPQP